MNDIDDLERELPKDVPSRYAKLHRPPLRSIGNRCVRSLEFVRERISHIEVALRVPLGCGICLSQRLFVQLNARGHGES